MATAIHTMAPSTHQKTQYTFDQASDYHMKSATAAANANTRRHRKQHVRTPSEDTDPTDGGGSLTYSAASSINSAGESTDSSFADIMKVLDLQDPSELGPLIKEKGLSPAEYHMQSQQTANYPSHHPNNKARSSQVSVASSLQYSTDGESNFLHGADLVSTITGQPSDSMANDGGSYNAESDPFAMFAPADHTDGIKKRKKEKMRSKSKDSASSDSRSSPKPGVQSMLSLSSSVNTGTATTRHKNNSTPSAPMPPKKSDPVDNTTIDDDICNPEWWMSCFPDAFKEMMPKRC